MKVRNRQPQYGARSEGARQLGLTARRSQVPTTRAGAVHRQRRPHRRCHGSCASAMRSATRNRRTDREATPPGALASVKEVGGLIREMVGVGALGGGEIGVRINIGTRTGRTDGHGHGRKTSRRLRLRRRPLWLHPRSTRARLKTISVGRTLLRWTVAHLAM